MRLSCAGDVVNESEILLVIKFEDKKRRTDIIEHEPFGPSSGSAEAGARSEFLRVNVRSPLSFYRLGIRKGAMEAEKWGSSSYFSS